jgi:hypothetical protein
VYRCLGRRSCRVPPPMLRAIVVVSSEALASLDSVSGSPVTWLENT